MCLTRSHPTGPKRHGAIQPTAFEAKMTASMRQRSKQKRRRPASRRLGAMMRHAFRGSSGKKVCDLSEMQLPQEQLSPRLLVNPASGLVHKIFFCSTASLSSKMARCRKSRKRKRRRTRRPKSRKKMTKVKTRRMLPKCPVFKLPGNSNHFAVECWTNRGCVVLPMFFSRPVGDLHGPEHIHKLFLTTEVAETCSANKVSQQPGLMVPDSRKQWLRRMGLLDTITQEFGTSQAAKQLLDPLPLDVTLAGWVTCTGTKIPQDKKSKSDDSDDSDAPKKKAAKKSDDSSDSEKVDFCLQPCTPKNVECQGLERFVVWQPHFLEWGACVCVYI